MRLSEPIETSGFFWLPDSPDEELPGILRISTSGGTTLELDGLFGNPLANLQTTGLDVHPAPEVDPPDMKRIVGRVEKGGPVTLDGCMRTRWTWGNYEKAHFRATLALLGARYEEDEEVTFSDFTFSADGLDDWLSISGIVVNQNIKHRSGSIDFQLPKEISVSLPGGIALEFRFVLTSPGVSFPMFDASVTQNAFVNLTFGEPQPIEDILLIIRKLSNFLSLAVDQTVSIKSITGYLGEDSQRRPVSIYGEIGPAVDAKPRISTHHMLFAYRDVERQIEQSLTNWLAVYEIFRPSIDLYFASRSEVKQYLEVVFLQLAQAIETLHRRSHQDTVMPEAEFRELVSSLVQECPEGKRDWLAGNLQYANEPSLRQRMKVMVEPFRPWFGSPGRSKDFINRFVATRNYLTHYDDTSAQQKGLQERICGF